MGVVGVEWGEEHCVCVCGCHSNDQCMCVRLP